MDPRIGAKTLSTLFTTDDGGGTWVVVRPYDLAKLRFSLEFLEKVTDDFLTVTVNAFLRGIERFYFVDKEGNWKVLEFDDESATILPAEEPTKEEDKWNYHYLKVLSE